MVPVRLALRLDPVGLERQQGQDLPVHQLVPAVLPAHVGQPALCLLGRDLPYLIIPQGAGGSDQSRHGHQERYDDQNFPKR